MFKLKSSEYEKEMPGIRWQSEELRASQFGDSEFMAACEGIGCFSRESLGRILTAYIDNKAFMAGNRRSGEPNWHHPAGVALVGILEFGNRDCDSVIADLIHDFKEDSPVFQGHKSLVGEFENFSPFDMLSFRYSERAAKIAMSVSKPPSPLPKDQMPPDMKERYLRFVYNRVINLYPEIRKWAAQTKVRDRIFNLRTENNQERLARNLVETIRYIVPIALHAGSDYQDALSDQVREWGDILTAEQKGQAVAQELNVE